MLLPRLLQETFRGVSLPVPRSSLLTYLTLLKTMSTSVRVMLLPSITPQSLQSLDQFLPCISLPVARVSPWMAKRRNASSRAVSSTGVEEPMPPSLVPLESDESLLDPRSLEWSVCGRKGTGLILGCLAIWTLKSSALFLGEKTQAQYHLQTATFQSSKQIEGCQISFVLANLFLSSVISPVDSLDFNGLGIAICIIRSSIIYLFTLFKYLDITSVKLFK